MMVAGSAETCYDGKALEALKHGSRWILSTEMIAEYRTLPRTISSAGEEHGMIPLPSESGRRLDMHTRIVDPTRPSVGNDEGAPKLFMT